MINFTVGIGRDRQEIVAGHEVARLDAMTIEISELHPIEEDPGQGEIANVS